MSQFRRRLKLLLIECKGFLGLGIHQRYTDFDSVCEKFSCVTEWMTFVLPRLSRQAKGKERSWVFFTFS